MMEINELKKLMKVVALAKDNAPISYSYSKNGQLVTENLSYSAANETLRRELAELVGTGDGTMNLWRENKNKVFALVEQVITEVLPPRAMQRYGQFAEVRTFKQGDRPIFVRRNMGTERAKQFVTRVGLAGVYEVFKLGGESLEVQTSAIGGAAQMQIEEFLDGRADFPQVIRILMDGIDDFLYCEIAAALNASINQLPTANKVAVNGFNEQAMDHLVQTARVYGNPSIYCTYDFAVKMIPQTNWVSDTMRDTRWNVGYLGNYKSCPVVVMPQSFTDGTNARKIIDPGYIWVIPSGADTKPVKVAFEGSAQSRERENEDWSRDFQIYQKVGVGVMASNNICSYVDTSLLNKFENSVLPEWQA